MRTTVAEVKEIVTTSLSDTVIASLIEAASEIVTIKLGSIEVMTPILLREIERQLSAHLISIRDSSTINQGGTVTYEKVGETERRYANDVLLRSQGPATLQATSYGQQAIILDISGTLANLGKRKAKIETIQATLE